MNKDELTQWVRQQHFQALNDDHQSLSRPERRKTDPPPVNCQEWMNEWNKQRKDIESKKKGSLQKTADMRSATHDRMKEDFDNMISNEVKFWDTDQVVDMWHVPEKKTTCKKNRRKKRKNLKVLETIRGHHVGRLDDGKHEMLDTGWVEENIGGHMRNVLKSNANNRHTLPAGDVNNGSVVDVNKLKVPGAPPCKFQQNDKKTCVFSSFASCLHCLGHTHAANRVDALAGNHSLKVDNMDRLKCALEETLGKRCCTRNYKKGALNLLDLNQQHEKSGKSFPTVAVLQGEDGGVEHAVTVYGSWLFDSNVDVALPLNKKSLDWCIVGRFKCVHQAVRFFLPKPKNKGPVKRVKKN
mmetsp:Transcript_13339/g.18620  ORF Transcript_13339/g.18620 Transcript_13339/m.18620 type:complete len:354 (-) Transcript_13339:32-1093(-)